MSRNIPPPGERGERPPVDSMLLARLHPDERLTRLRSNANGLTAAESADRLGRFGPNQPVAPESVHPIRAFLGQFTHTLALLLWFAGGLAFAAGIPELGGAVLAVIVLNGVFAFVQEHRAEQVVLALMRNVAVQARVLRDGLLSVVPASDLVPGDIVRLAAGDIAPADCTVLESDGLTVDLSMLTGETVPVERSSDASPADATLTALEAANIVPAGAAIVSGAASALVFATGAVSSVGMVAGLVASVEKRESILERQVGQLSRVTATVAVVAGAATLSLAALFTETSFVAALTFGTGVIVALVPEGLLPTLSVALAIGARRMAERGAVVRRLSAVEIVGSVTTICTDKTGTLTENAITVRGTAEIDGSTATTSELLRAAVLCNDCVESDGILSGDPIDRALWLWAKTQGSEPTDLVRRHPRLAAQAFNARTRYMVAECDIDGSPTTLVKGAPEAVLEYIGAAHLPEPLDRAMQEATSAGDRVLLFAWGPGPAELAPRGIVRFSDPPRTGVPEAVSACRRAGVRIVMLTGDHPTTALSVARSIGMGTDDISPITGRDVDRMSDRALSEALSTDAIVARIDPEQKLRIVRVLRAAGEVVVMTGDGVNDAPALRAADVGVAMGMRGTEVAKAAADIVLADDNFATIVTGIEEGRAIRANIRRFVSYVFTSNVAEMVPFLAYIFLPVPLPLAVIQALAVDVGTDLLPALALGTEAPSEGTMAESPEPPGRPLLTRALGIRTFLFFGVIEAALGLAGFFAYYLWAGWQPGTPLATYESIANQATTLTFLCIVGGQVGCLFAQREGPLLRRLSLRSNRWIGFGLAFEIALAFVLIFVPGLNHLFKMEAVSLPWLCALPAAATVFLALDQVRRMFGQRAQRAATAR